MCSMTDVCFMCTNDNNCIVVDNQIVNKVEYLLPEITIIKLNISLFICSTCETSLYSFSKFKKVCLENSMRLEAKIKETQTCSAPDTLLQKDNDVTIDNNAALGAKVVKLKEILPLEGHSNVKIKMMAALHFFAHRSYQKSVARRISVEKDSYVDTPLKGDSTTHASATDTHQNTNNQVATDEISASETTNQTFEQIFIKEEPLNTDNDEESYDEMRNEETDNQNNIEYHCPVCNDLFTNYTNMRRHIKKHNEFRKKYHCPLCGRLFAYKINLEKHIKDHNRTKRFVCHICNKTFTKNYNLQSHLKVHTGKLDHKCNLCNKMFTDSSNFKRHIRSHAGIKKFQCNLCKKLFTANQSLMRHLKTHSDIRDFHCTLCNKFFTQAGGLKIHMKRHNNIRDYECSICKKSFTQSGHLKGHMKSHSNEKNCICCICKTVFRSTGKLKDHLRVCKKK